jgi:hypothetical protein
MLPPLVRLPPGLPAAAGLAGSTAALIRAVNAASSKASFTLDFAMEF